MKNADYAGCLDSAIFRSCWPLMHVHLTCPERKQPHCLRYTLHNKPEGKVFKAVNMFAFEGSMGYAGLTTNGVEEAVSQLRMQEKSVEENNEKRPESGWKAHSGTWLQGWISENLIVHEDWCQFIQVKIQ